MTSKTVLVTGAGGFIGQAFVRGFLNAGWAVRAADLAHVDLTELAKLGAETMTMDLTDQATLPAIVEGVGTVVHNAGIFDLAADPKLLWSVNADGASFMAEAAADAGAQRFIMISSTSVYGRIPPPTEEDAPKKPYHDYSASKWAGEQRATEVCDREGLSMATLRPTLVYGPGSRYGIAPLFCLYALAKEKPFTPPGLKKGSTIHVIHIDDVVGAALHMAAHPELTGPFNVADEKAISVQQLSDAILNSLGMTPGSLRIPGQTMGIVRLFKGTLGLAMKPLNAMAGDAWEKVCRSRDLEPKLSPRIDVDWLDFLSHDSTFDISRLRSSGYRFCHPSIETGIPQTTDWYRAQRWLPPAP